MNQEMSFANQLILSKEQLTLTVLNKTHAAELTDLACEKTIWEHAPAPYYQPHIFKEKWFDHAIAQMAAGDRVCFVIFFNDKMIGSSSYYEIDLANKKTNIGYTWFHPSHWGTPVNAISKLILLEYAFEELKLNRVGFAVDRLNERSCRALEKYGITREGILRNHLVLPDRNRDTVIFSVIHSEWKTVKEKLINKIEKS